MNSREMMKALTISKAVFSFARKKHKDKAFFYEFLRKVAHRVEIDKDIDWTPENINYFMHFVVKSRDFYSKNFKIGTMFEIFEVGLKTLHQFNVSELANFTVLSLSIDYEAYEQVYKELVIKFNNETSN